MASPASRWLRPLVFLAVLFAFFLAIDLLGLSFSLFGKGFSTMLVERTSNPFVGLFVGILATALVQSSSTTTSLTVALVAADALTVAGAIPIIMGANIGTSVTNILVSLGHMTRRTEFERAFAGASVHDLFNLLAVAVLLPFEIATGLLARSSIVLASAAGGIGGLELFDPIRTVIRPVSLAIAELLGRTPLLVLAAALVLLFVALKLLVDFLRAIMSGRAEQVLHRTLFRSATAAVTAGLVMTVMVQSSSITTSVMVPLVAAGVVTLEQVFPFTIGANIGTTVTAIIAALATGSAEALTVAFAHLLFNLAGAAILFVPPPTRAIPLALARALGRMAVRNRIYGILYVLIVFFILPFLLIMLSEAD